MITLQLRKNGNRIELNGNPLFATINFYSGRKYNGDYDALEYIDSSYRGYLKISGKGGECYLTDTWYVKNNSIQLNRRIHLRQTIKEFIDGVQVNLKVPLPKGNWDFFMPAACYGESLLETYQDKLIIIEERLPYPLILAYDEAYNHGLVFVRVNTPVWSETPQRQKGAESFLHATDIGGMGYQRETDESFGAIVVSLPYREGPISRALDRTLRPLSAFLPVNCSREIEVIYELRAISASNYAEACLRAYKLAFSINNPKPIELPFTIYDALKYRIQALANLVHNWNGYTGLKLNFNPRIGVDAPPIGYGREFNKIKSEVFPRVLEYGFTGRQLNNAYLLMCLGDQWDQLGWAQLGEDIADSFVDKCPHQSGFLYTLYDVERGQPFLPFGDPVGAALHYGVADAVSGNYLRNMVEAAYDLTLCYGITKKSSWLKAALNFGHYLTNIQNKDGSWYRAYTPEGKPINKPEAWFGHTPKGQKASTSVPISFLVQLYKMIPRECFLVAAEKAGHWLLTEIIETSDYRGGTLDNANVVDKESMGYAMSGLLSLYEQTGKCEYLDGARKAGGLALTWNYLWDVPFEPRTRLQLYNFRTRGWGGIDVLWAGSVVDCYSLYFVRDWLRLAELTGEEIFKDIAIMIIKGTQQLLSYPDNHYGLIAPGMQEEGFACSNLGMDEDLIQKGDTWGSLGWVYAITTYAILQVLREFPMLCES